jgi:hypothetical protein
LVGEYSRAWRRLAPLWWKHTRERRRFVGFNSQYVRRQPLEVKPIIEFKL